MKSLKERLEEKRLRQAKEDAKLSGPVKSYRFSLPFNGSPYMSKESDVQYVKGRAKALFEKIKRFSPREIIDQLRDEINAFDKARAESLTRRSWWNTDVYSGIAKYIVVVEKADGTLLHEDGTIYRKDAPTTTLTPAVSSTLNERAKQLSDRLHELQAASERMEAELADGERPTTREDAERLLANANSIEADLNEVLRDINAAEQTAGEPQSTLTDVQQALNEAMREISLTPEQEDAIIQPVGTQPLPAPESLWGEWRILPMSEQPLAEGLTFPMDLVTSESGNGSAVS